MRGAAPHISVILPAYHSDRRIAACLEALEAQTFRDFEVIVVNSSQETRTSELVASRFPRVIFHQHPTRLMPHAARNAGVKLARGALLVFTDPDCVPGEGWLAAIAEAARRSPVVQGSVNLRDGSWLERGIHLCKRFSLLEGIAPYSPWIVSSINVCYSREAWRAAGPFDGDVFCGDALLGWRAAERGYQAWFEPAAVVWDSHDGSFRDLVRERYARGREFGIFRAAYERWTAWRAAAFVAAAPALLALILWRTGRSAAAAGWFGTFVLTLPIPVAGQLAWVLGESRSYAARAIGAGPRRARHGVMQQHSS